jgi:hypothetical protein
MAHSGTRSAAATAEIKSIVFYQFAVRLIISSVSSTVGTISIFLAGPTMWRIATIDPALEATYLTLVAAWFWTLAKMWSLTFQVRKSRR